MYDVAVPHSVAKQIKKLPQQVLKRVLKEIDGLGNNPRPPNNKKLAGEETRFLMGYTADCKLTYEGKAYSGKAMLETDYLEFKGDLKLKVPFKAITSAALQREAIQVKFDGRAALFDVGKQSEKWLQKILNPKSLLDKLGVKPDYKVCVLKIADENFLADLEKRVTKFSTRLVAECHVIFLGAEKESDLAGLGRCKESLKKDGAIWVVNPKGQKAFNENHVLSAGKKAGLVDVKVVKFSETHTAHRFVVPKAQR